MPDRADIRRRAYLAAVLGEMKIPDREAQVRATARALLDKKRVDGTIGARHAATWDWLLGLPIPDLKRRLLAETEEGRELRHAHLFAGILPARARNRIRKEADIPVES